MSKLFFLYGYEYWTVRQKYKRRLLAGGRIDGGRDGCSGPEITTGMVAAYFKDAGTPFALDASELQAPWL